MQIVLTEQDFEAQLESGKREAMKSFGDKGGSIGRSIGSSIGRSIERFMGSFIGRSIFLEVQLKVPKFVIISFHSRYENCSDRTRF